MTNPSILVCFAVKQEAAPFRRIIARHPGVRIQVTGMGKANALRSVRAEMDRARPDLVITSGFAGGLNATLSNGTVIFSSDTLPQLAEMLSKAKAVPVTFHCADRVAITAAEKLKVREMTQADAVEMESGVICDLCRDRGIPVVTVRVISDASYEDLPLDFNQLMNANYEMDYPKLALTLIKAPGKIGKLMQFDKCLKRGAGNLANVLQALIQGVSPR